MKKSKIIVLSLLVISLLGFNSVVVANNLPFENYKLAVKSFEAKDWESTKHYLDKVILNDLSYSNYLAKSIYLKTILLAAEVERDLQLKKAFKAGREQVPLSQQEKREEFKNQFKDYQLKAERKVDTLVGLANYLVSNLPPLEVNLGYQYGVGSYNPAQLSEIKKGVMPQQQPLEQLEEDLLAKKINEYLKMSLKLKGFNDISVVRADKGDNLYKLSKEYNIPFYLLLSANNHLSNPDNIYPGQKIYIPQLNNTYIDYPAYFYYLSQLSYEVNPKRREDITRLVVKAYQLTNQGNKSIDQEARDLTNEMNVDQYNNRFKAQSKLIARQNKELKELRKKYNKLLEELQRLKSNLNEDEESKNENKSSYFTEDEEKNNNNLNKDPLKY
ncbi:hypothetical protein JCM16358_05800 [Halanaerocella petrolearia]